MLPCDGSLPAFPHGNLVGVQSHVDLSRSPSEGQARGEPVPFHFPWIFHAKFRLYTSSVDKRLPAQRKCQGVLGHQQASSPTRLRTQRLRCPSLHLQERLH